MREWKKRGLGALAVLAVSGAAYAAVTAGPSIAVTAKSSSDCVLNSP